MSRSRQNTERPVNPAEMFLKWDSEAGAWYDWDKDAKEKVEVEMSTPFIYLDSLTTVTGYSNEHGGIYSNEVRSVNNTLKVMAGKDCIAEGSWKDVSEKVKSMGGKYATSLYAMAKVDGEYKLVNFKLSGCSITPWIQFEQEIGGKAALEGSIAVGVVSTEDKKVGRVEFTAPVFGILSKQITPDAEVEAGEMDLKLQTYLDAYFEYNKGSGIGSVTAKLDDLEPELPEDDSDLPF